MHSVIIGTGSYIPTKIIYNKDFINHEFYDLNGNIFEKPNEEVIEQFEKITGIKERRYVTNDLLASDIAFIAAEEALASSKIDKESLDYIIVAHNLGDVSAGNKIPDIVPTIASRVKHKLKIENPYTIPYDLPFGCPGWIQGMIHADYFLKSGDAKRALIIGAETLSRMSDPHDRDQMIYSDGAGATIIEATPGNEPVGILSHVTQSDTLDQAYLLYLDKSYNPNYNGDELYLKMKGRKVYQYALKMVPQVVKKSIEKAELSLGDIRKILIHQANTKMDEAILKRLFLLYGEKDVPPDIMPMVISWLGNSSVATVPTLLDLLLKGRLDNHDVMKGANLVFASIGAGMNINSMVYRMP